MSGEFWYGVLLSAFLFVLGSIISVFSPDMRETYLIWRSNRNLKGAEIRLKRLERELEKVKYLSTNPAAATATFWSGLFLVLAVFMHSAIFLFLLQSIKSSLYRGIVVICGCVLWVTVFSLVRLLHNRADSLIRPEETISNLQAAIEKEKMVLQSEST